MLRRIAADAGAALVELAGFGGRRVMLPDVVHPTSAGQLAIADIAARALGAVRLPSSLAEPATGRWATARYEAWWWRLWLRDVMRRGSERRRVSAVA